MVLGKAFQKMPYAGQNFENDRHSKAGFCGQIQCGPGHYPTPTLLSQCVHHTDRSIHACVFDAPVTDLLVGSRLMYVLLNFSRRWVKTLVQHRQP